MSHSQYYDQKTDSYKVGGGRLRSVKALLPKEPKRILDIGCGEGHLAKVLKGRGHEVFGVDISPTAIKQAQPYLSRGFVFDIEQEQWPADLLLEKFDLVIASEVIEHIFDPEAFLKKARTLLRNDGRLLVTTPNILFWKNRLRMLLGVFRYEKKGLMDFGHIRFFAIATLQETLQLAGYKILRAHHVYPNLYHRKLTFLGRLLPGFFAYQFVFLCEKT